MSILDDGSLLYNSKVLSALDSVSQSETFFLIDEVADLLIDENGDNLTWRGDL